jgi:hypothetical protein
MAIHSITSVHSYGGRPLRNFFHLPNPRRHLDYTTFLLLPPSNHSIPISSISSVRVVVYSLYKVVTVCCSHSHYSLLPATAFTTTSVSSLLLRVFGKRPELYARNLVNPPIHVNNMAEHANTGDGCATYTRASVLLLCS